MKTAKNLHIQSLWTLNAERVRQILGHNDNFLLWLAGIKFGLLYVWTSVQIIMHSTIAK